MHICKKLLNAVYITCRRRITHGYIQNMAGDMIIDSFMIKGTYLSCVSWKRNRRRHNCPSSPGTCLIQEPIGHLGFLDIQMWKSSQQHSHVIFAVIQSSALHISVYKPNTWSSSCSFPLSSNKGSLYQSPDPMFRVLAWTIPCYI